MHSETVEIPTADGLADAYLTLDDREKACAALKDVKDRAQGTSYQSKVDARLETCQ